ncbi:MAG: radical SAM peptide maturase, CXXX-repeat target family [Clostridia bacterium]|nr:radical SAM peptide maturase, CXXX-repeat target family [Clostridia bacterium]
MKTNELRLPLRDRNINDVYAQMYPGRKMKSVTFIVTYGCPLDCGYCYCHYKDRNKSMSLETAKKCVDLLFEEDAKHSSYINEESTHGIILDFIGGEPLLEIKLIDQIVDYFLLKAVELDHRWATQFMISMTSNGVHYFDKDVIDFLKKHEHRVSIAITIDGNKELHDSCRVFPDGRGSYDLAAAAFKDAKERFNYHGTKMTLAKANIKYLYKACRDMIETFDLTELWANCVYEDEWDAKDASLFYAELKKMADWFVESGQYEKTYFELFNGDVGVPLLPEDNQNWCGGTGDMLAFDIDGTCYPCMRYAPLSMPKEMSKQFVIGHCDTGLETTECQHNCVECLKKITRRSQSTDKCWNCPIGRGCAWCSAWNAECNGGNPDKRCTNICIMHQARCLATRYYYGKLAKKLGIENHFALNVPEEWALEIIDKKEYEMLKEMK